MNNKLFLNAFTGSVKFVQFFGGDSGFGGRIHGRRNLLQSTVFGKHPGCPARTAAKVDTLAEHSAFCSATGALINNTVQIIGAEGLCYAHLVIELPLPVVKRKFAF